MREKHKCAPRWSPFLLVLWTAVLTAGCSERPDAVAGQERDLLDRRQAEFAEAMADGDADRMAALFADDAVVHVAGMPPVEGRDAIRPFYEGLFGFLASSSLTPETTRVAESADMAYSVGTTSNAFDGPEGLEEYTGKYVLVWRNVGGDWRVAAYSVSSDE